VGPVSVMAASPGDLHHVTDRLAARALRLALDPSAERSQGAAELAWLAGDSPCYLARARRRLRSADRGGRSRIVDRAEQLLADAQSSAETGAGRLESQRLGVVTSIGTAAGRRGGEA
jgi:hypothetical protein